MGLLKSKKCLKWTDILKNKEKLKQSGIEQFIRNYSKNKNKICDEHLWGDELEFLMIGIKDGYKLLLISDEIREELKNDTRMVVNPEFAGYMIETTPDKPYNYSFCNLYKVEENITMRIRILEDVISKVCERMETFGFPILCSAFPGIGVKNVFLDRNGIPELKFEETKSKYFPDNAITNHPRFNSFQKNVTKRRGRIPEGYVRIMKDSRSEDKMIEIDNFGLGMGCCCLHTTFQALELKECLYIYDQLAAISPLILRMTRATPFSQGYLLDTETRWDFLSFATDCRTDEERGTKFYISNDRINTQSPIPKGRFSSIDFYLSEDPRNHPNYNDLKVPYSEDDYQKLKKAGVTENLAKHIASLFVRDPLLIYDETDDNEENSQCELFIKNEKNIKFGEYEKENIDDFLNIQTSNWRSLRLKIPENDTGWRIEIRVNEIQPTAFENTSFCIFNFLFAQTVKAYKLNFYIPLSLVDENFRRANKFIRKPEEFTKKLSKDEQKFYFRLNICDDGPPEIHEGTLDVILNGTVGYVGIIPLIYHFLEEYCSKDEKIKRYLEFIEKKCKGDYISVSDWIRKFVINHPAYKKDSVISEDIQNDLIHGFKRVLDSNDVKYLENK